MKKFLPLAVLVLVLVGAGAFFGGMKYAEARKQPGQFGDNWQGGNQSGQRGSGQMGTRAMAGKNGMVMGEILSKDDKSITVKIAEGGSKIVFFSDSTEIGKYVSGTPSDLEIGKSVTSNGSANADGSINAESIQLRNVFLRQPGSGSPVRP